MSEPGNSTTIPFHPAAADLDFPSISSRKASFSSLRSVRSLSSILFNTRPYRRVRGSRSIVDDSERDGSWSLYTIGSNDSVFNLPFPDPDISNPSLIRDVKDIILPIPPQVLFNPYWHALVKNDPAGEAAQLRNSPPPTPDITVGPTYTYALRDAIERRENREVHSLLRHGHDVNEKDSELRSPLELAVESGFEEVVSTLLAFGANTDTKDSLGR